MRTRPRASRRSPRKRRWWPALAAVGALAVAAGAWLVLGGASAALPPGAVGSVEAPDYHSLAFSPADANVVFFGHHNGLMRSDDGGRSWQNTSFSGPNRDAMALAASPEQPQLMYLAGHEVFYRSRDGGRNWEALRDAQLPGLDIHAFAMRPDRPERLWAWVVGYGLFHSQDAGGAWHLAPGRLQGDVASLAVLPGDPETVLAGTGRSGIFAQMNGGPGWSALSGAPRAAWSLTVDPRTRGRVYAASGEGLYRSDDAGQSWETLPFPGKAPQVVTLSSAQPGLLLALSVEQGRGVLYRSLDWGASWTG